MSLVGEQVLLRVYLENADRAPRVPTFKRIVRAAVKERMAGATVLKGILGAGYHGVIRPSAWSIAEHVPVIVEIVDNGERIISFVTNVLSKIMVRGMFTLERAAVAMYRQRSPQHPPPLPAAVAARVCPDCGVELPPAAGYCPKCGSAVTPPGGAAKSPIQIATEVKPLSTMPRFEPGANMRINENGILLRVFIGESDVYQHKPLYEAIVQKVRELGLAGATVLKGTEGFGAHSVVHTTSFLEMSTDLPIVIEIIDAEEKIKLLLPHLDVMVEEGLITMEYVMIVAYRHGKPDGVAPPAPDIVPPV